jgi:Domain of unknown function (DUF5615)
MTIWVDAHLSPAIAAWIVKTFGIPAFALRDLGLRDAEDPEIFEAAREQKVVLMTKDSDAVSNDVEYLGFMDVFHIFDEKVGQGTEVYSLMRESGLSGRD